MNRPLIRTAACLLLTVASGTTQAAPADLERLPGDGARVTRHFASAGDLQIHYRRAGTARGDHRPVLCLHQSPNSSQVYVEFLAELGRDRLVLAPDTPGYGESDRPARQPTIADYVAAFERFADSLELEQVDLVGYHTGAAVAIEWALTSPDRIGHLMLVGVPAFTPDEIEQFSARPWPQPRPLGAVMLTEEWEGSKSWQGQGQSDASVERTFLAKIGAGRTAWWGPSAVFAYPLETRLAQTRQPMTMVRAGDDLWEATARARKARPDADFIEVPEYKFAVFEIAPARMAELARRRFDAAGPRAP